MTLENLRNLVKIGELNEEQSGKKEFDGQKESSMKIAQNRAYVKWG